MSYCRPASALKELFREEKRQHRARSPPFRPTLWRLDPVAGPNSDLHRLRTNLKELADDQIDRNRPISLVPVVGRLTVKRDGRFCFCYVTNKWLHECGVNITPSPDIS